MSRLNCPQGTGTTSRPNRRLSHPLSKGLSKSQLVPLSLHPCVTGLYDEAGQKNSPAMPGEPVDPPRHNKVLGFSFAKFYMLSAQETL